MFTDTNEEGKLVLQQGPRIFIEQGFYRRPGGSGFEKRGMGDNEPLLSERAADYVAAGENEVSFR